MFIADDGSCKARIIYTGEHNWRTPVIEVFRWSDDAAGWVHVGEAKDADELATIVDLDTLAAFDEFSELAEKAPLNLRSGRWETCGRNVRRHE